MVLNTVLLFLVTETGRPEPGPVRWVLNTITTTRILKDYETISATTMTATKHINRNNAPTVTKTTTIKTNF